MVKVEMAGKKLAEFEFPVEKGKIKEFSMATGNKHPLYLDQEYAKQAGFSNVIMPVTFPVTFPFHMGMDNAVMEAMSMLGMNPTTSVHGEVEFTHFRSVEAGEALNCEMVVGKIFVKEGAKGGQMTFVEIIFNLFDADKKLVCIASNIFIEKS